MKREDIIRMAKEAGLQLAINAECYPVITEQLSRFAELISAEERKACAKLCTDRYEKYLEPEVIEIADAIMSRFPTLSELLESKHT